MKTYNNNEILNLKEQLKSAERKEKRYAILEERASCVMDRQKYKRLKNKFSDLADSIYDKIND